MNLHLPNDTICAIATATGGAIGVVRVSGPKTLKAVSHVCTRITATTPARTAVLTPVVSVNGETIDDAIATLYPAPHSYTGEDCAEISCHGSRYILSKVLEALLDNGCRMAQPGEFTQCAFLNGKMDLSQAEAVADLIAANSAASHHIALSQLRGHFSSELHHLRDQLLKLTSLLELELDFADHEELEFANRSQLQQLAQQIKAKINALIKSFEQGQALKSGIPVAIVGKTNVGKSTLLNRLVKDERAIVSDIHGTTRDTIEDTIQLQGIQFRFIDTAGIRQTKDQVEQIGIKRSFDAIEKARIVLWVIDAPPTLEEVDEMHKRCTDKPLIIIQNKIDIEPSAITVRDTHVVQVSAKNNQHINALEDAIVSALDIPDISTTDVIVTSARHYESLISAHNSLSHVIDGISTEMPTELIAEDLRLALSALGEITGDTITPQETLNNIFSHFCVGK